jgi:hypothetical protein
MSPSRPPGKGLPRESDAIETALPCSPPVHVAPPLPATYLADAPCLSMPLSIGSPLSIPDEQLDKMPRLRLELQKQIRDAAIAIRRRRTDYERENGVVIIPETPVAD